MKKVNMIAAILAAMVMSASLTGCVRGNSNELPQQITQEVAVETVEAARSGVVLAENNEAEEKVEEASAVDDKPQIVPRPPVFKVKEMPDVTEKIVSPPVVGTADGPKEEAETETETETETKTEVVQEVPETPDDASSTVPEEEGEMTESAVDEIVSQIVSYEEGVNEELVSLVKKNAGLVPKGILDLFQQKEWSVKIVSGLGPRFGYKSILGLTKYDHETLYIDNRMKAADAIIHEMGHFYDAYGWKDNDRVSDEDDFVAIFEAEAPAFRGYWSTDKANTATSVEYFAETFAAYILDPASLEAACPQTYAYMVGFIPA